jgi:glycosyltransferase involved in cell wall biosynthesis
LNNCPANIGVYYIDKQINDKKNFVYRQLTKIINLSNIIKSIKPHIVFAVLFDAALITRLVRMVFRIMFIIISREPHNHLKDLKGSNSFKDMLRAKLLSFAFSGSDIIVTVSKGSMKELSDCYKIPIEKFKIIYNSVDVNKIIALAGMPNDLSPLQHPAVVSLGRLVYRKGFQNLITALKLLPATHLYLIGKGDYEASLLALTEEAGLNDRVHFLGYLENPYNILRQADVFAFPSLWEGFGNVIIEAMACGVPVVATRCPHGPEEIITDGADGLLVPVDDSNALATAILRLLKDEPFRKRLVEGGKRRSEDFRVEKKMREYERLFLEIAGNYLSPCKINRNNVW